jgi:hypothetical protein
MWGSIISTLRFSDLIGAHVIILILQRLQAIPIDNEIA